jgi:guanylate kinase
MGTKVSRVSVPPRKMIAITAPSGAGKSSLVKKLLLHLPQLSFSVSCTTRAPRSAEQNGREYYFISEQDFRSQISSSSFAEYEEVYPGKFYGTLKSEIDRIWNSGKVVLFDIDVKGAANLKKLYGDDCLVIFIQPPSMESLTERLKNRNTEDAGSMKARLKRAEEELKFSAQADRVVLNRDFDTAYMRTKNHILSYIKAETVHIY